ncbi:MarR family winged helix-turn-helix transcriptional regulator [Pseudogemmobacter sonorensis]|uniref:MarR family winged helix-turn-helix transcriptional regulator n=1 Tax=Pseudogemmobacter sonorensis TaxID=2989681 RepID=UPI00367E7EBF
MTERRISLAHLIAQVNRRIEGSLSARLREGGLTVEHFRVLSALMEQNGRTMSDLAAFALVDPPTMTKMIDRLVANGAVFRAPDPVDRRKVLVFISERGKTLHQSAEAPVREYEHELNKMLGATEQAQLTHLLRCMLN